MRHGRPPPRPRPCSTPPAAGSSIYRAVEADYGRLPREFHALVTVQSIRPYLDGTQALVASAKRRRRYGGLLSGSSEFISARADITSAAGVGEAWRGEIRLAAWSPGIVRPAAYRGRNRRPVAACGPRPVLGCCVARSRPRNCQRHPRREYFRHAGAASVEGFAPA